MLPLPSFTFCEQLFGFGVATAEPWGIDNSAQSTAIDELIHRVDRLARLDAPATAPSLDLPAVHWSLSVLAWAVNLLVDRANPTTTLPDILASTEPSGQSGCHHWSVDLAFRYWADVVLRAQAVASQDALVSELRKICLRWPLAGVGTQTEWRADRGQVVLNDPCLRFVLLDRIIARSDKKLAEDPALERYIESRRVGFSK